MFIYSRTGFTPRTRNRARGIAGAECSGAMQAVVTGQSAQGLAGAECRGSLISYAIGYAGAEARGAPAIKALGFAGAEAGGTLETATPAYSNGYKNYLEFLIPAGNIEVAGILNCLLCIDDTFAALATDDNGGLVEHASGYDMQMELADGTVIPFARLLWEASTGRIVTRARFATLPQADARFRLFFGKTTVTDGANEGSAYAAHLMAPNMQTGVDRTGLSRNWTPTGITAGTLAGFSATFDGTTSQIVRVNPTELNGLGNITIQALVQFDSATGDKSIFLAGPDTSSSFGLHLRFQGSTGRLMFTIRVGANSTTVESPDGLMPAPGVPMLVAATWTSGQAPKLFVGGELVTLEVPGTALSGTTNATLGAASSEALIGYNRASGNRWAGQIADLMVSARVLTQGHLQTQERSYLTPRDCYGVGETNSASVVNHSPVLPPIFATATVGVMSEVDPALIAYEGDTGQTKTLEALTGSGGGTSNIVGGRAQFTPSAAGTWRRTATVKDNGTPIMRCLAPIIWAVSAAPAAVPRNPPAALRTLRVPEDYLTLAAAHAVAIPGDHIEFASSTYGAYGVYGETDAQKNASLSAGNHFVWTKAGTAANPIVLKSRTGAGAVMVMHLDISAQHVWLHNLTFRRPGTDPSRIKGARNDNYTSALMWGTNPNYSVRLGASNTKVTNCLIESSNGICVPSSSSNIDICWNDFQCRAPLIWHQCIGLYLGAFNPTSRGSDNVLVARNKWWNDLNFTTGGGADGRYCVYSGNNEPIDNKTGVNRSVRFIENFVDVTTIPVGWYLKRDYYHERNFIRARNVAFNQRHGGYSNSAGTAFSDITDAKIGQIIGCNFDRGIFRLNDGPRLIVSCRMGQTTELYYGGRRTDGPNLASYTIAGSNPGYTQAASDNEFVGCSFVGDMRAGEDEGTSAKPWKVWGPAEQTRWGNGEPAQGDTIKNVRVYEAGVTSPAQPTESNGKFVRITNAYGEVTVAAGTAGFQSLSGDNGRTALLRAYVTRDELEFNTGRSAP